MGFAVATLALTVAAVHLACGSRSSAAPVSATAASSGGEAALTADAIAAAVDPVIRRALAEEGIPGAAFVFVQADRIVYAQGYGVEDRERGVSVDVERTVWPVASVTKLFTGLAALQLVDSGALRLDQDINRYLKQVVVPAQGYPPITLAHLLSHSAALNELPGRQFDPDRVHARRSANFFETRLVRYRAPGLYTAYSSYGIALVGVAIEDASGVAYDEFIRRRILEPCGMRTARIMQRHGELEGVTPTGYRRMNRGVDAARAAELRVYQGRYRSSLACHTCPDVGAGQDFELAVRADGTLELWGQEWRPLARDLFVRADGERLLGFARDTRGQVAVLSAGSWRVADRWPPDAAR